LSHSWIEVEVEVVVEGPWRRIDTFINDIELYRWDEAGVGASRLANGFSLALKDGEVSPVLDLDHEVFQQMAAVTNDHGVWDDPSDYYASPNDRNRPGPLKLLAYSLTIGAVNARVAALRRRGSD